MANEQILLVEDSVQVRQFLADVVLSGAGYDVLTAATGDEGLVLARDLQPDLIIADYLMPGRTGLEMLAELRAESFDLPLILITAEGSEALAVEALRLGVSDYLIKPFDPDDLLAAVARVLRDHWTRRIQQHVPEQLFEANLRLERRLRDLDAILRDVADVLIIVNADGNILFGNPAACATFGIDFSARRGQPLADVLDHDEVVDLFQIGLHGHSHEITLGKHTLHAQISTVEGVGRIAVMQDITHLKELSRVKSEFVTTVSHDLRSPLTAILGYVELLSRTGPLNDHQQEFVERIIFSVQSITSLITDLLELGKIEAGFDQAREPTALNMIVRYCVESQRHQWETKQHHLYLSLADNLPPVLAHPLRLRQMINNLLENAIKYTPEGGDIRVILEAADEFLVLQVVDSGIGIPLPDQPYIFDKFYRTDEAIDHFSGTGLGLAIVKRVVDQHDGRIWVDSEAGVGTAFTVMLPTYNGEED